MSVLDVAGAVALVLIGAALVLTGVRLVKGPTAPDRAVAADVLVALLVAALVVVVALDPSSVFVPVVLVLSLLGFIGSVTVARFTGRGDR